MNHRIPPRRQQGRSTWAGRLIAGLLGLTAAWAQAQVGRTQLDVGGLPVTLVYPTEAAPTRQSVGGVEMVFASDAALAAGAPRRLVVLSHGSGGSPLRDHSLATALAGAGFVVAQPLHAGDNYLDHTQSGPATWQTRPGEVSRVIDALAADPRWAPRLRLDRVGVHGMSAGGVTGLALAGAQWRLLNLLQHCAAHMDEDSTFCFAGAADAARQAERRAAYQRVPGVPEAFLPAELKVLHGGRTPGAETTGFDPRPDARIASVTLAVPVAAPFSAESLARIAIPVGVVAASADTVLLPAYHSAHVLRHCSRCTLLDELQGGAHMDVVDPLPPGPGSAASAPTSEAPIAFDPQRRSAAQARIVDFHRRHLGGN
jgi:predicted dienelactone hydrolase